MAPQNGAVGHVVYTKSFLFLSAILIEDAPRHFEIYTILLPLCVVATAVKVMCTYYGRIFEYDLNTHFLPFSFKLCKKLISLLYCCSFFRVLPSAHCVSGKERKPVLLEKWALLIFLIVCGSYIVYGCCTSFLGIHHSVHKKLPSFIL